MLKQKSITRLLRSEIKQTTITVIQGGHVLSSTYVNKKGKKKKEKKNRSTNIIQ